MSPLPIGTLAKLTGVKVTTIRFYESIGLLPEPLRTHSDRRIYKESDVRRLGFIRHARQLGFAVEAIRDLLELSDHPERLCDDANVIAQEQLASVDAKIALLGALREELVRMTAVGCSGPAAICQVIESLKEYRPCSVHLEPTAGPSRTQTTPVGSGLADA